MLIEMASRAERKQQTHADLLAAARVVAAEKGFPTATARDVAATAGVAVGTVFAHFPTMASLAEHLLDETIGAALETAQASQPDGDGLIEQLVHVSATLFDAYRRDPDLSRHVISASLFEADPQGPSARRLAEFGAWVGQRVEEAVAAGEIAPIDVAEAFGGYFALYFGVLIAGLRGDLEPSAQPVVLRSLLTRLLQPVGA